MTEALTADPLPSFSSKQGRPLLAGLVGRGIQESRSPRMHESEGARLGLHYRYKLLDFDRLQLADDALADLILAAERQGFVGLNVTHPFKESVIAYLDGLSPDAAAIGAVNTMVFREGTRFGHNTDCWGFAESFRRSMGGVPLDNVVQLGAGGAGMAVARALVDLGVGRLAIYDSNRAKSAVLATSLAAAFGVARVRAIDEVETIIGTANGLVNATPVGMAKYPGMPVSRDWLRRDLWVADIVYFPAETELLRAAGERGSRVLSGTGMAIFQAVKAFELITAVMPDAKEMARHFGGTGAAAPTPADTTKGARLDQGKPLR
ncbi:MAG: shikimate dehydrogenase [Kiloniellales bacterium]